MNDRLPAVVNHAIHQAVARRRKGLGVATI
jgi:hypothetical protein